MRRPFVPTYACQKAKAKRKREGCIAVNIALQERRYSMTKTEKKWFLATGIGWALLLFLVFFVFWFFTKSAVGLFKSENPHSVTQPPVNAAEYSVEYEGVEYVQNPDVVGILLLGLQQQAVENVLVGPQADTVVLLTINTETRSASLLSVPRNLYSTLFLPDVNGDVMVTQQGPLCNAYAFGGNPTVTNRPLDGGQFTAASLSHEMLEIPIERFAGVDMNVLRELVDLLGGIEVPLTPFFAEQFQIPMAETVRIGGDSLEFYLRYRDQSLPDGGVAERTERHIYFMKQLLHAVLVGCGDNPKFIYNMFDIVVSNMTTDLSLREMVYITALLMSDPEPQLSTLPSEKQEDGTDRMDEAAMHAYILDLYYEPANG